MFKKLDMNQKQIVFQALKRLVESASGIGFHNHDQGHPFYSSGAEGKTDAFPDGDSPKENDMYKMLSELSRDFKAHDQTGYVWWYDFSEWQDFCKFAYDAHCKAREQ